MSISSKTGAHGIFWELLVLMSPPGGLSRLQQRILHLLVTVDAVRFVYAPGANIAPVATIDSISPNPAQPDETVIFEGHGTDIDGSVETYSWRSSRDGHLSDSASFSSSSLSVCTHTILFKVQDDSGDWSEEVTETLTIGEAPLEVIIDNGDTGTSYTGTWGVSGAADPYGADSFWSREGATYTWHADLPQTGVYEVYMWWTEYPFRSSNAPVTIEYNGGSQVVHVNQQQNGGKWNYLSTYSFSVASGGTVTITAVDAYPTSYCADAVRFVYAPGANVPPIATIESITPNPAQPGEMISFEGHGTDIDGTVVNYRWQSNIDGHLSDSASFDTSTLSEGVHTIFFEVQDNELAWSYEVSEKLIIGEAPTVLVCYGDSITNSWYAPDAGIYPDTLNESLSNYNDAPIEVINEGYGGWTSSDGASYVATIIASHPDMDRVCLMFGTNDAHPNHNTPLSEYKNNMGYMIDAFQAEGIEVILGILPPVCNDRVYQRDRALDLNEKIRELALEKEVYIADTSFYFNDTWSSVYYQDSVHPNRVGYEVIGNTSFFLPIVDSHRLHNGYNLLSTNTIVANDSVEEINVRATTWDEDRVNITVTTYNSTQFTFVAKGTTNITINMGDGLFDISPSTEYYVYRDGFSYINISSTLDGYLVFTVPLGGIHTVDVFDTYHTPISQIIIDNGDTGTSYTGTWSVSGGENPYGTPSLWGRDGATYSWHADLPQTGEYEVYMWWTEYSSRSTNAPVTITHLGGSQVVYVNQQQNGSRWNHLGLYSFDASSGGDVRITAEDTSPTSYCADAVMFVYMPDLKAQNAALSIAPSIIGYAPDDAVVNDTEGLERAFNISVNQIANVSWRINGTEVCNQTGVTEANYTSTNTTVGYWDVSAVVENVNGTALHTWMWNVTPYEAPAAPCIKGYEPEEAAVNDTEGLERVFNISVNQIANVRDM